ncbi:centrosome-associated protein CEP250-like [Haliotis rufescens]|uniref:centrosome-associated protein CEP250-like n=1 Tax=Haliotis rufescens TaxID=6454 RepID=UPI00201F14D1|nr:centrosome-associated protein CEP250-like [Haliotis rufescens]
MSQNGMPQDFHHYTPQHPLPGPIQEMPRGETVCQYCGVSYLIHNEIKALEEKLAAAEEELQHLRGGPKREEELTSQLNQQRDIITLLKAEAAHKDECISGLQNVIQSSEEKLNAIQQGQNDISQTAEKLRKHNVDLCDQLRRTSSSLKQHRTEITSLKEQMNQQKTDSSELIKTISTQILQAWQAYAKSGEEMESRMGVLQMENNVLTQSSKTLKTELAEHKVKVDRLNTVQAQCDKLTDSVSKLTSEVSSLTSTNRQLSMEAQQFQEQLRLKTKESEDHLTQSRRRDQHLETALSQVTQELQEKIADLAACKKKLKDMENRFVEHHRKEEEFNSRTAATINESKELKEALTRLRGDMEALKDERELMITAHHNRIEQLRESFKNKLAETEHWPERLEQALKSEREKHQVEMTVFSQNLKDDFVLELQVEKDKYDKLVEKYQSEHRGKNSEVEQRLVEQQNQHERDITNMRIKMDSELKVLREELARAVETEQDLRKEVASLKAIIANLENRLGLLSEGSVEEMQTLKEMLSQMRLNLDQQKDQVRGTEARLAEAMEENLFLQETVRKECEERFELTEALSDAKRELLELKRPAGGYPSSAGSQRSGYHGNIPRKTGSVISLASVPSQPVSARTNTTPPSDQPASNNIGYHGESAKPPGKIRGGSVAENRRRIATILGKR